MQKTNISYDSQTNTQNHIQLIYENFGHSAIALSGSYKSMDMCIVFLFVKFVCISF